MSDPEHQETPAEPSPEIEAEVNNAESEAAVNLEAEPEERELSAFEQAMVDEVDEGDVNEGNDGEVVPEKQEDVPNSEAATHLSDDTRYVEVEALESAIPKEETGIDSGANNEAAPTEETKNTSSSEMRSTEEKGSEERKPQSEAPKKSGDPVADRNKLFIGGISLRCNKDIFHDFFAVYGPITDCFCISKRGFGFVTFANEDSVKAVLAKQAARELIMDGKNLDVKVAVPRDDLQNPSKSKLKITLRPKRGRSADRQPQPVSSVKRISTSSFVNRQERDRRDARDTRDSRDDRSRRDVRDSRDGYSHRDDYRTSHDPRTSGHRETSRPSSSYRDSRDYRSEHTSGRDYKDPRDYRERDYYAREKEPSRDYRESRGSDIRHDDRREPRSDYPRDSGNNNSNNKDYSSRDAGSHKDYREAPSGRDSLRDQQSHASRDTREYRTYSPPRDYQSRDYASSSQGTRDKYYEKEYTPRDTKDYTKDYSSSHDTSSYRAPSPRAREPEQSKSYAREPPRDYRNDSTLRYRETAPADTRSYGGNRQPSPQRDVRDTRRDYETTSYRREDPYQKSVAKPSASPYAAQQQTSSYAPSSRGASSYGSSAPSYSSSSASGSYPSANSYSQQAPSTYSSSSYPSNPYTTPAPTYGASSSSYPSYR